ncbi:MAG TPA: sigma factor-like helix-turn-helix DNA-binding protein [Candidatus Dormibacteraeota bacterium]|nr:sigma factor-like helix-turn-helix DNA-binding protein [Candidatus Dormibacteraeota bacterium]
MEGTRVERTLLHRAFGVFRYSEELDKNGVSSPSEQITAIGLFIEKVLAHARSLPPLTDERRVTEWMQSAIASFVANSRVTPIKPETLQSLLLRTTPLVVWDPYEDFAELLNIKCGVTAYSLAAQHLRRRGFTVDLSALHGLADHFLNARLPAAVRSFDPVRGFGHEVGWLSRVFYRFALNVIVSDEINRNHIEALGLERPVRATPEDALVDSSRAELLESLPEAIESLDPGPRQALELYFGVGQREHTLGEVARSLHVSEFRARGLVIRALQELTVGLGVQGLLESTEYELLRLAFGEGVPVGAAANKLGISQKEARGLMRRIGSKFEQSLRPRTVVPPHVRQGTDPLEVDMVKNLRPDSISILESIKRLRDEPVLRRDPLTRRLHVELPSGRVPLSRVRAIVTDPDVYPILEAEGVSLDWVAIPEDERADLPEDAPEIDQAVQELSSRAWVIAEALYHHWQEAADEQHIDLLNERKEHTVERIRRSLAGATHIIESQLPRALRRNGMAIFEIDSERGLGKWEGDPAGVSFDIRILVADRAVALGEIQSDHAELLGAVFLEELVAEGVTFPGFHPEEHSTPKTIRLRWISPTLEAELSEATRSR